MLRLVLSQALYFTGTEQAPLERDRPPDVVCVLCACDVDVL